MYPKRHKDGYLIFSDHPEFKPNLTPKEVFQSGAFGGTYWRPIHSGVTGKNYKNLHKKYPFLKGIPDSKMTLPYSEYNKSANKYGCRVGSTLEFWESRLWIRPLNPYGWTHWYCDFYSGIRGPDDEYQIKRWLGVAGPNGRFKRNLINQIKKAGKKYDSFDISPKIRQVLLHWSVSLTADDLKN
jgi:hypothetical protein